MAWYQRNFFKYFIWVFILIIVSVIIPIQIFLFIIFIFFYLFLFIFNFLKLKLNFLDIKNIEYRKKNFKNINLIFLKFFLLDLPKKKAFYVFYNFIKFIYCTKNKLALFGVFKHYKLIFVAFKKYFAAYLFKFLTSFSLISVKNTNFIYHKFFNIFNKNWKDFISFYSNFIFNLLIDYNDIQNKIKNCRIIFNSKEKKVIVNPYNIKELSMKIHVHKMFEKIKDLTSYNIALNDAKYLSSISTVTYNSSKPIIVCGFQLNNKFTMNTSLVPEKNIVILNRINNTYKATEKYLISDEELLAKLNQKNIHTISNYNENSDFKNLIGNYILNDWTENDLKSVFVEGDTKFFRIPIHIVPNDSQNLIDASVNIEKFEDLSDIKLKFAKDIVLYWNNYVLEYRLLENNNLFLEKTDVTLGEFLLKNKNSCEFNVRSIIEVIDQFQNDNKDLISKLSFKELKSCLDDVETPDNLSTLLTYELTSNFEKQGQNVLDVADSFDLKVVDCKDIVDKWGESFKMITDK